MGRSSWAIAQTRNRVRCVQRASQSWNCRFPDSVIQHLPEIQGSLDPTAPTPEVAQPARENGGGNGKASSTTNFFVVKLVMVGKPFADVLGIGPWEIRRRPRKAGGQKSIAGGKEAR